MEISPKQWERVKELFEAALECAPNERAAFLERNADDEVVRSEVNRLLAGHSGIGTFLSTPAFVDPRHPSDSRERLPPDEVWSGRFRVDGFIAAGGMGEVYRARDSKLARDVALKVLPPSFARDASRLTRFQREAKVLASLNHPNIASIHGLEDSGGIYALVLELVEGPTLADRLRQGPLPIGEVLPVAKQICDALEYAHEHGIVHRDLKPANIKITRDDTVKILDFGLAKAIESDPASADISNSPTLSRMATDAGILLGTAAYMSPEQARGKVVDRRADIWAFGCVLYEMLTGKKAFPGETATDTLAVVLNNDPDWSLLPAATPTRVRVLLQRCLHKDVKQRLQAIAEARIVLEEVLSGAPDADAVGVERLGVRMWRSALPWALFFLTLAALGWLVSLYIRRNPVVLGAPVHRYEIATPSPMVSVADLSPDGTHLVFHDSRVPNRLWLGRIDSLDVHPIEGTEDAFGAPFWSADSRFIAFTADGKFKKVDIEGDPPQVLCDSGPLVSGGFWTSGGQIIFADPFRAPALWEVPESGGVSSPLRTVDRSGESRYGPVLLPDGKHFLYTNGSNGVSGDIYLGSLDRAIDQSSKKILTQVFNRVHYAPSQTDPDLGYLLYVRDGTTRTLVAQPFDLRKLELAGEPVPIAEEVYNWSASLTDTLVYSGSVLAAGHHQLTMFDRQGKILGTVGDPGDYDSVAFSPDGKRAVVARFDFPSGSENLWMIDLVRDISTRFTFDSASDGDPVWSPDGSSIVFASDRGGTFDAIYRRSSNGGGDDELLFKSDHGADPESWSNDGRFLLFDTVSSASASDQISVLPVDTNGHVTGRPLPFAQGSVESEGKFSTGPASHPRWIAYSSDESGRSEIYVRPFDPNSPTGTPPSGGKWQVSADGGVSPRWNKSSKELFYVALDGTVMSVEVSDTPAFRAAKPKPLFKPRGFSTPAKTDVHWDVSSDGKRFIFAVSPSPIGTAAPARLTVVLNWTSLLKK